MLRDDVASTSVESHCKCDISTSVRRQFYVIYRDCIDVNPTSLRGAGAIVMQHMIPSTLVR